MHFSTISHLYQQTEMFTAEHPFNNIKMKDLVTLIVTYFLKRAILDLIADRGIGVPQTHLVYYFP